MSYTKTTWVNNTTPINETNLNKIEQGIYDNSLVVEAIADKLNPTDTETYKTAELTEEQITDVIGVNDIIIKGQTSQNGEPTPSSPVDINVVSGSNVINTSNKNLFDGLFRQGSANTLTDTKNVFNQNNKLFKAGTYTFSTNLPNTMKFAIFGNTQKFPTANAVTYNSTFKNNITQFTFTFSQDLYLGLMIAKADNSAIIPNDISTYHFQIEQNNSATSYIAHQGKELPLDLPVENLFDKNNAEKYTGFTNGSDYKVAYNTVIKSIIIPCKENTTYTVSKINGGNYDRFNIASFATKPTTGTMASKYVGDNSLTSLTITTGPNDTYIMVLYYHTSETVYSENDILDSIQIEQGSKANAYTPYGTDPIELCKIGDYQDYFYKSGSKWYLHKEIGKVVLDGSETEGWNLTATYTNNTRFTSTSSKTSLGANNNLISNYFVEGEAGTDTTNIDTNKTSKMLMITIPNAIANTLDGFKNWLSNNNVIVYYSLATAKDTEITDTTLISQLEAIYNAPLYEQTNITQTNNDLPMVLDITACKDNINGIKAFIRK